VSDKVKLTAKQKQKLGKPVEILEYDTPESNFIALESVTLQNIRIVHVIDLKEKSYIKIGRGHDVDIRVTDISVSRYHARISQDPKGDFYVDDNKSKFGTLL
jgi:pSer/pThr/pTyr-binding forkhead associated (FHA) protein